MQKEVITMPLVSQSNILDYIPQRPPIVMISEIENCDTESITSNFTIDDTNIFVADGNMQEAGMIENIAQTAAAMTGYHAKQSNQAVKRGFIGSVKKLTINQLPITNATITTQVKIVTQVMNATVIEGTIMQNNQKMATCTMNIFLEE